MREKHKLELMDFAAESVSQKNIFTHMDILFNPPASKASREVADLTKRKNPHTPVYGVKEFFCLSVRL